jgi:hypothetical protein
MARAYLKFKRTGTFEYTGGCAVDVDDPASLKDIWAAANDFLFKGFIVKDREYDNEGWAFELIEVEERDVVAQND